MVGSFLSADIYETEEEIIIYVDIPGFTMDSITWTLHDFVLSISVERRHLDHLQITRTVLEERSYGSYVRKIYLPPSINQFHAPRAVMENGVFQVCMYGYI